MLKLSTRRWNTSIAILLIAAIIVTLFPVRASAQPDNEGQIEQTASESPKPDSEDSASAEPSPGEQPADETETANEPEPAPAAGTEGQSEQTVALAAAAAPVLTPIKPYTNQPLIHVAGTTEPGAKVTVYLTDNRNVKTAAGQITADAQGSFMVDAPLPADGVYKFTAIALTGTQSSPESAPVLVTLDRVNPSAPQKSTWLSGGSGEITLQWKSTELPGQLKFEVYRNDELVTTTSEEEFIDSGLPPQSLVTYKLISEDLAGNRSNAISIEAGSLPERLTMLGTSSAGAIGNGYYSYPAISGDGSIAAFLSDSTNLIDGTGDEENMLLYIRDLTQNTLEAVSPEESVHPSGTIVLNQNGQVVVFSANTGTYSDLYVKVRGASGNLTRITAGNGESYSPSISADGKLIAFISNASNLTAGDTNETADVFLYNRETGLTTRITASEEGYDIKLAQLSANGSYLAWSQIGHEQDNVPSPIILYNISSGESTTISEDASYEVSISADGRYVSYTTEDRIYVYDRIAAASKLITDGNVSNSYISGDGSWIVFPDAGQMRWVNIDTGEYKMVGNPAAASYPSAITANGSKVAFTGDYTASRNEESGFFPQMIYVVCPVSCSSDPGTDIPIQNVSWTASSKLKDQVKLDGNLTITTIGAQDGVSQARVSYRFAPASGADTEVRELTVPLVESTVKPGTYTGKLSLQEGMTEIVSIIGEITDRTGKSTSLGSERLPLKVSGAVRAELELFPKSIDPVVLTGARLIAWSPGKKTGAQVAFNGVNTLVLPLADAADYTVSLIGADGTSLAEAPSVTVNNGHFTPLNLSVHTPAHIRLRITGVNDANGLAGATVSVTDSAGELIGSAVTNTDGSAAIEAGFVGEDVNLSYEVPSPYAALLPETITLETITEIQKEAQIQYGTVAGTVRDADGKAFANATVTVTRPNSILSTQTDENGSFELSAPAGASMISVTSGAQQQYQLVQPEPILVKSGAETPVALIVKDSRKQLNVELSTRFIGEQAQRLDINGNTGETFDLDIRDERGASIYRNSLDFPTVWYQTYTGAKLQVCMIDRHERFAEVCQPVTADGTQTPKVIFNLQERAAVTGSMPQGLKDVGMFLFELTESGKRQINGTFRKEGSFRISLAHNSTYVLSIRARDTATDKWVGATRELSAADGQIVDIGMLQFQDNGVFTNKPGNTFDVLGSDATEGGLIRLRGTYLYDGIKPLTEAALLLQIPAGTSLVSQSVMLSGQPAEQINTSLPAEAVVTLAAPLAKGASGTITYQLRTEEHSSDYVLPELGIRFKAEGDASSKEEIIGSVFVNMVTVSLAAPAFVTKRSFQVSGRAPASSTVVILDGQQAIGQVEATPTGLWSQAVTLTDNAQSGTHALSIRVIRGEDSWNSNPTFVTYDPNHPVPIELTISQPGIRTYKADVSSGIARFPYSLAPNKPLLLALKFSHSERVEHAVLQVAGEDIPLTFNPLTGQFEAVKTSHQEKMGSITVTYDVLPLPYEPGSPTIEDLWQELPAELRGANLKVTQVEQGIAKSLAPEDAQIYVATIEASLDEAPEDKLTGEFYYEPMPDSYQPPALPAGEPEVYDVRTTFDSADMSGSISAVIPVADAAAMFANQGGITTMDAKVHYIRYIYGFKFAVKTPGAGSPLGLLAVLYGGYAYKQKQNQLDGLLDQVLGSACLSAANTRYYSSRLEGLNRQLLENQIMSYMFTIGGIAMAATGIGFIAGVAIVATTAALSYKLNHDWSNEVEELKTELAGDTAECEEKPSDPDSPPAEEESSDDSPTIPGIPPIAEPDWIYDPSGYVFEAVESNRIDGVTASLLKQSTDGTTWTLWNADRYLQQNPIQTDEEGRYAWDVPEGNWQVKYTKDGYDAAKSEVLTVLPPHFDVNIGLVSRQAPQVTGVLQTQNKDGFLVSFSKYMLPDTLTADSIHLYLTGGDEEVEVPVTVEPVHTEADPQGRLLAKGYKVAVQTPLAAGSTYRISIDSMVQSYAGVPMVEPINKEVTVVEMLPAVQDIVSAVTAIPGYYAIGIQWEEAENAEADHLLLKWKLAGSGSEQEMTIAAGDHMAALRKLPAGTYDITLVTVSADGRQSAGVSLQGQSLAKTAPPVETTPPAEVSGADISLGAKALTVNWTDPADLDLSYINARIKKPGAADFEAPIQVASGVSTYTFSGLTVPGVYEIKLSTVDIRGNESAGISLRGTIPTDEPNPDTAIIVVAHGRVAYDAFDKALGLHIPTGGLPAGTRIGITKSTSAPQAPSDYLKLRSPVYSLESVERPSKKVQLTLKYDKKDLKDLDPLKLGIYRYDANYPNKWKLIGGTVIPAKGEIRADITEWGTYAVLFYDFHFSDLVNHWSREQAEVLASRGMMLGTPDGRFEPNREVTRAEMTQMLVDFYLKIKELPLDPAGTRTSFRDIPAGAPYASYAAAAVKYGIISNGLTFRPNDPITREELAVLIARVLELCSIKLKEVAVMPNFNDHNEISSWAKKAIISAITSGLMQGAGPDKLLPKSHVTRGQTAIILFRLAVSLQWISE